MIRVFHCLLIDRIRSFFFFDFNFHFLLGTAFTSMIEGKNEEISTSELSGGARIQYIFQNIFVKCLEVCFLDLNDMDIPCSILENSNVVYSTLSLHEWISGLHYLFIILFLT